MVENVAQGDPARFELRVIRGAQLQVLLTQREEHRYYEFPVRAGDYAKLRYLEE